MLDYIYGMFYSSAYREKYKEFLKIDFPRVHYPEDSVKFWQLLKLGSQLRELHLLESSTVSNFITIYPLSGTNEITTGISRNDLHIMDSENPVDRI
ncbi:MAG: type ISP restriction/modification enzyme [Candidatus Saccharimonadaceae bacterium]